MRKYLKVWLFRASLVGVILMNYCSDASASNHNSEFRKEQNCLIAIIDDFEKGNFEIARKKILSISKTQAAYSKSFGIEIGLGICAENLNELAEAEKHFNNANQLLTSICYERRFPSSFIKFLKASKVELSKSKLPQGQKSLLLLARSLRTPDLNGLLFAESTSGDCLYLGRDSFTLEIKKKGAITEKGSGTFTLNIENEIVRRGERSKLGLLILHPSRVTNATEIRVSTTPPVRYEILGKEDPLDVVQLLQETKEPGFPESLGIVDQFNCSLRN